MSDFQEKLRAAKQIERQLKLQNRQLKNFVEYLRASASQKSSFIPCGGCIRNYIPVDQAFHRAFKYFTKEQKISYYHTIVTILRKCLQPNYCVPTETEIGPKILNYYFFNDDEGAWQPRRIEVNYEKKKFIFTSQNHEIDLHYYILRNSKKSDRKSLALESIEDLQTPTTIRVSNHKDSFEQLKNLLEKLIFEATEQRFREILDKSSLQNSRKKNQNEIRLSRAPSMKELPNELNKSITVPFGDPQSRKRENQTQQSIILNNKVSNQISLNQKEMTKAQFELTKLKLMNSLTKLNTQDFAEKNLYINERQNRVRKIHEIKEEDFSFSLQWFKDLLLSPFAFKKWKPTLKSAQTVQSSQNLKIYYQEHQFKQKHKISYLYKREIYQIQPNELYVMDYSAEDKKNQFKPTSHIHYVIWKFQKVSTFITITVEARIAYEPTRPIKLGTSFTSQFIGQLSKLYQNTNITLIGDSNFHLNTFIFQRGYMQQIRETGFQDSQVFFSIQDNTSTIINHSDINIADQIEKDIADQSIQEVKLPQTSFKSPNKRQKNRLNFKHPTEPYPKPNAPRLKLPKTKGQCPYWQNQFRFNDQGDMISINQKKKQNQSGILGDVLKSLAKNFLSGKSILNISLPVKIFSNESNLSLLCKSLAYAPLHLEKAAKAKNPVQRMKYVVAFATGCTTAYIQMDKPFNPILGETFHCLIDGCPVYGEQISHHPPISAMFMKGRGYTIYGCFEAKVNMGLNSATGSNEGICHISFDEKDYKRKVVKYNYQPGEISGLAGGDRIIHAVGSSCYLDEENYLFLELKFGKKGGKKISEYGKYHNGIEGQLIQLDRSTDITKFPSIKVKSDAEKIGIFEGRWSKEIYYDDEVIFNSWQQYPYECQEYPFPLQSDAFYRKDLLLKIENKLEQAQVAKQELENIQRNDRALRKKYTGSSH